MAERAWRPVLDRVLVKVVHEDGHKTLGSGIIVASGKDTRLKKGIVVATGPGRYNDSGTLNPVRVERGEEVLFLDKTGWTIFIDGEDHLVLDEGSLMVSR